MSGIGSFPWAVFATAVALLVYPLPGWLAYRKSHEKRAAILALNLFLGWTFLGWIAALAWATTRADTNVPEFLRGPTRIEPTLGQATEWH